MAKKFSWQDLWTGRNEPDRNPNLLHPWKKSEDLVGKIDMEDLGYEV